MSDDEEKDDDSVKELSDDFLPEVVDANPEDVDGMHIVDSEDEEDPPDLGETYTDGRFEE